MRLSVYNTKHLIAIFIFIIASVNLSYGQKDNLQNIEQIKSNDLYIWGEGEAKDRKEARQIAENRLLTQIQVSINIDTYSEQSERETNAGTTFVDDFQKKHKSFTGLYLKGLKSIFLKKKKTWYVFRYIHKNDLKKSFNLRKEKIRSFTFSGQRAAKKGRINEALRNFYWGYLLALSYPDTINFSSSLQTLPKNPQVALTTSLNSIIEKIEISPDLCYKEGDIVMVPLNFHFSDLPIQELSFNYYSGMGTDYGLVEDGHAEIPLYDKPTSSTRKLTLKIEYTYENEMSTDPEIMDLYDIFKENKFNALKSVSLSFPWIGTTSKRRADEKIKMKTEAIDVLKERKEIRDFLDVLVQYKKLGAVNFGRRSDFGNGKNCFVAIADNKQVVEILYYDGMSFISMNNNKTYLNLSDKFKGKRQIWIKEVIN